ncbi:MAG: ATP-binding protein [Atopobiaceae bacterium]|nr:ATP-binding protein [Atopobiaceae bacterium]
MAENELLKEIRAGESKTLELKEALPSRAERWVKTVVAFSNSAGGKLVVGVSDGGGVAGVDDARRTADAAANAIDDLCEPQVTPRIRVEELDGRDVVVIEVQPGTATPYHLKGGGEECGTYVRLGATTRPADGASLRELRLRGSGQYYDEQPCLDAPFDEGAVQRLCDEMNRRRRDADRGGEVTLRSLENWGLVKRLDGERVPTRALLLLTSNPFEFARIQCAQFKGTDRVVFLDRRDYGGPLYEQIDEAEDFVLRNIRLGARIEGLYREDYYEIPRTAIREAIVNAVVHRDLQASSCVQVALYDDRLEVTSPGTLYGGLTLEDALGGTTRLRNPRVANALMQMDLFENWGTGIRRIREACAEAGLPEPEFRELGSAFRVNIFRLRLEIPERERPGAASDGDSLSHGKSAPVPLEVFSQLNDNEKAAVKLAAEKGRVTTAGLVEFAGISRRSAIRVLKRLAEGGLLEWHGRNPSDPTQFYSLRG